MAVAAGVDRLDFVWLELTGRCQLRCSHCYVESGPDGDHGTMTTADWRRVIEEAAELGARSVVLIGGEPTLHPDLAALIQQALDHGLEVELYSNLARPLRRELWSVLERSGVRLATSYYAADATTQERITLGAAGSHRRTRANIVEALHRGIPIRVGVVEVDDAQDVKAAVADLRELGVADVDVDRLRQVGRGVRELEPSVDELCGNCATRRLAITASGDVLPCVFSRWLPVGNVRRDDLATIELRDTTARLRSELERSFTGRGLRTCHPTCNPEKRPKRAPNPTPVSDERPFLADALSVALATMGLVRDGELTYSTFADSVGVRVLDGAVPKWLRVYPQWDRPEQRTGWAESVAIVGVAKPHWFGCLDFQRMGKPMRADLLSLAPSPAVTSAMVLTKSPTLTADWYTELRRSVTALQGWPTERGSRSPERWTRSVERHMGSSFRSTITRWTTEHKDMHWCNLTAPEFCLLDWDSWGTAPYAFGPATLYCAALLVPDVAAAVHDVFRDQLDTPDGRISTVVAAGHLLDMTREGHYRELADPLLDLLRSLRDD